MAHRDEFDIHNPWHAHAYFSVGFSCDQCGRVLGHPALDGDPTRAWHVLISREAFRLGWKIPLARLDGRHELLRAWCPDCGRDMLRPFYGRAERMPADID